MSGDIKKRKPGRPPGSKNKTALVRLDKAAAVVAAQVSALKAEDKLYTLGKVAAPGLVGEINVDVNCVLRDGCGPLARKRQIARGLRAKRGLTKGQPRLTPRLHG